jgi:hypothetical protein
MPECGAMMGDNHTSRAERMLDAGQRRVIGENAVCLDAVRYTTNTSLHLYPNLG